MHKQAIVHFNSYQEWYTWYVFSIFVYDENAVKLILPLVNLSFVLTLKLNERKGF